jgi:type II secretory pathway pseudopilin PulG
MRRVRAFTLIEFLAVLIVCVGAMAVLILTLRASMARRYRPMKDATQVRGIHQGLILWRQSNSDRYPLPSELDAANQTVNAESPETKDTTANIISILLYNGFFSPELCISPQESSPSIKVFEQYAYSEPPTAAAADKTLALWDPAFNTDFTGGKTGHFSYAHALPSGAARRRLWSNTLVATEAVIGNRGPEIAASNKGKSRKVSPSPRSAFSNTYGIHGPRTTWEGNIAYGDNAVHYETSMFTETANGSLTYTDTAGVKWNDLLFFDEPDDVAGTNNYLGNFIKAGKEPADFTAIWD